MRKLRGLALLSTLAVALVSTVVLSAQPAAAAGPQYKIQVFHSRMCLTVFDGTGLGSSAMQWNCDGFPNGRWTFDFVGATGYAKLRNMSTGLCLTVFSGSGSGDRVMQWNCDGFPNGLWTGQLVNNEGPDWYNLVNKETGWCLSIFGNALYLGAVTVLGSCDPSNFNNRFTWYP